MSYPGYKHTPFNPRLNDSTPRLSASTSDLPFQNHPPAAVNYAHQPAYDWSQQNQQSYGNGGSQEYNTSGWEGNNAQAYQYSQQQHQTYTALASVASPGYAATTSQNQASATALNSLAYASGLESAGINNRPSQPSQPISGSVHSSHSRKPTQDSVAPQTSKSSAYVDDGYRVNRSGSAASAHSHLYQAPHSPYQYPQVGASGSEIEDATGGHRTQKSFQSSQSSGYRFSTGKASTISNPISQSSSVIYSNVSPRSSPQISGSRPNSSTLVGQTVNQSASSTGLAPPLPQSSSRPLNNLGPAAGRQVSSSVTNESVSATAATMGIGYTSKLRTSAIHSDESRRQDLPQPSILNQSAQLSDSGAYGGSHDEGSKQQRINGKLHSADYSSSYQTSNTQNSMPGFIDPSQVYNPYQQEYERRKAAEFDAEAKAEAERVRVAAEAQREKEDQEQAVEHTSEPHVVESLRERKKRNRKSEPDPASKAARRGGTNRRKSDSVEATLKAATTLTSSMWPAKSGGDGGQAEGKEGEVGEEDEEEVRFLMERIKRLKTKDHTKFQQLLGSVGESASTTVASERAAEIPKAAPASTIAPSPQPKPDSESRDRSQRTFHYTPPESTPEGLPDLGKHRANRRFPYNNGPKEQLGASPNGSLIRENGIADVSSSTLHLTPAGSHSQWDTHPPNPQHLGSSEFKFPTPSQLRFESSLGPPNTSMGPALAPLKRTIYDSSHAHPPAPQPQSRPIGTVWPEMKRKVLAEAAVRTLLSTNPANREKHLTTALILSLLEQNPSYPELCEKLESRGIILHRGNFAKALLQAVPDLASPSTQTPTTPNTVVLPTPTLAVTQQSGSPQTGPPARVPQRLAAFTRMGTDSPVQGQASTRIISWPTTAPGPSLTSAQSRPAKHNRSVPAPAPQGPKEAMARKRDFSDIVDLTKGVDDDDSDHEPPSKEPPTEQPTIDPQLFKALPFQSSYQSPYRQDQPGGQGSFLPMPQTPKPPPLVGRLIETTTPRDINAPETEEQQAEKSRRSNVRSKIDLVQRLRKENALRKSIYNPLTIARDVLIAAGRHPTAEPLNSHLTPLSSRLPQIDSNSDLSTLRWDLIDPGGSEVVPDRSTEIPTNRHSSSGAKSSLTPTQNALVKLANEYRETQPSRFREPVAIESDRSPSVLITSRSPSVIVTASSSNMMPTTQGPSEPAGPKKRGRPPGSKNKITKDEPKRGPGRPPKDPSAPRVPRLPHQPHQTSPSPPSFQVFQCNWLNCGAKLHNLETLHKHFKKVHKHSEDDSACHWEGCHRADVQFDKRIMSNKITHSPHRFLNEGAWSRHVLTEHLEPIAWKLGEGPSIIQTNDPSDNTPSKLSAYLHDASGALVTPLINPGTKPSDPIVFMAEGSNKDELKPLEKLPSTPIRAYFKSHKTMTEHDKAKEVLRSIERKKSKIGSLIDRQGSTMVGRNNRDGLLRVTGDVKVLKDRFEWMRSGSGAAIKDTREMRRADEDDESDQY